MAYPLMINTFRYAKKLKHAGVPAPQAEAQAGYLAEVLEANSVTKQDLKTSETGLRTLIEKNHHELKQEIAVVQTSLENKIDAVQTSMENKIDTVQTNLENKIIGFRTDLEHKIENVQSGLKKDMQILKVDIIKWIVSLMFGQLALTISAIKLLH